MDDIFFHLLSAFGAESLSSAEAGATACMKDLDEAVSKLMVLKEVGFIDEKGGRYQITLRGEKVLETERMIRGGMLLSPTAPNREPGLANPKTAASTLSSSLAPTYIIRVDRWGNPDVRPLQRASKPIPGPRCLPKPKWRDRA